MSDNLPLPEPASINGVPGYTADQLRAYAAAAVAAEKHWRETVDDMLSVCHMVASNDPRESIDRLIDWHCSVYIDPLVSSDAAALVARTLRTASCAATIDVNSCGGKRARYWGLTFELSGGPGTPGPSARTQG